MLSHLSKPTKDAPPNEEEDILQPEPQHTSRPPVPPTDPYSILLVSVAELTLSHNQLHDDFYSMVSHFAIS